MTSSCTDCSNTGEITLDLTTGSVQGTLTNATVDPITVAGSGPDASVDCNYRARVKVKLLITCFTKNSNNLLNYPGRYGS